MNFYFINDIFSLQYTLRNTFGLLIVLSFAACHSREDEAKKISFPLKDNAATGRAIRQATLKRQSKPPKKKKKIYLTFDDGPNKGTPTVLNIIEQEQVPVTFFLVGSHVKGSHEQSTTFDLLKTSRVAELCNHSYSHAGNRYDKFYSNADSVVADFEKAQAVMQLQNNIARCPGRNAWRIDSLQVTDIKKSKAAIDSLYRKGYTVMGWDIEWHFDSKTMKPVQSPEKMVSEIDSAFTKNKIRHLDNIILLAHDQAYRKPDDSAALHRFIKLLKTNDDYELDVVSNYPLLTKIEIVPDTTGMK